jgi:hypothetical protein
MAPLGLSVYLGRLVDPNMGQLNPIQIFILTYIIFILILSYLPLVSSPQDFDPTKDMFHISYSFLPLLYYHYNFFICIINYEISWFFPGKTEVA